jgi:predicted DNA-binding protein (MmcQ/YjbR family)
MTVDMLRTICRTLPDVTEDIKWGHDLCFCVAGKMFTVVNLERPHSVAFKCTPETFGELIERPGIIPAPYMARNMWVQEQELGDVLDRRELESLVRTSYDLVVSKLPKSRRPGAATEAVRKKATTRTRSKRKASTRKSPRPTATAKPARRTRSRPR